MLDRLDLILASPQHGARRIRYVPKKRRLARLRP